MCTVFIKIIIDAVNFFFFNCTLNWHTKQILFATPDLEQTSIINKTHFIPQISNAVIIGLPLK